MTSEDADGLIAARSGVMVVTLAPRGVDNALIARLAAAGVIVSIGHAEATAEEAIAAFAAGASAVTHLYNAMSQLGHRQPGLVGAALADRNVLCGFIADGHHVHETAARAAFNAKGADGIALVSDAMPPAAGGPKVFYLEGRRVTQVGTQADARRRHAGRGGDHPDGRGALRDANAGDRPRRRAEDGDADPGAPAPRRPSPRAAEAGLSGRSGSSLRRP